MRRRQPGLGHRRDELADAADRAASGPEPEQDAVAELLHDPTAVDRDHAARDDVELRRELGRPLVAAGRRERRVPGEVDERDRRRIDRVWLRRARPLDRAAP